MKPNLLFNAEYYKKIDLARFNHFDTLNINLKDQIILELGAGIGNHTEFILSKNPKKVYVIEGREENISILKEKFKNNDKVIATLADLDKYIPQYEVVIDWIYNYGLLYHLNQPFDFIERLKLYPHKNMILETCISLDGETNNVTENSNNPTQSINGLGSRPNVNLLIEKLKEVYEEVFITSTTPDHSNFDLNSGDTLKRVVVVCRTKFK